MHGKLEGMTESTKPNPPFVQKDMERQIPRRWKIALIVTTIVLGLTVYPGKWLSSQPLIALLVAPRSLWIVVSLIALLISVIVFIVRWRRRLPRRVAALFMAITMVAAFANVIVGWGEGLRTFSLDSVTTKDKGYFGTDITVMSLNTFEGKSTPQDIAKLANKVGADILSLSEIDPQDARIVARLMEAAGSPMQVFDSVESTREGNSKRNNTSLLVSVYFGTYEVDKSITPNTHLGAVAVKPVSYDANFLYLPTLAAGHAFPPGVASTRKWRNDVAELLTLCHDARGGNLILAGDFNAAPWHGVLADTGACQSALSAADSGSVGTWPTYLPKILGIPIDHIMVSKTRWGTVSSTLTAVPGSDHRALLAKLRYLS